MNSESGNTTDVVERLLVDSLTGNEDAKQRLFELTNDRFTRLAHRMLQPFGGVRRWEETDDVWQSAGLRLWKSIQQLKINDAQHFYSLAALHIRRELIDLARRFAGPEGLGRNHASRAFPASDKSGDQPNEPHPECDTHNADKLATWTEFHQHVDQLDDEERVVFDLVWYQGLTQKEAAIVLEVSERTIKRRWQSARLSLYKYLNETLSE